MIGLYPGRVGRRNAVQQEQDPGYEPGKEV